MPDPDSRPKTDPSPLLGRFLAAVVCALVVMVTLGVLGIWRHAHREKAWRERAGASDQPFLTPTNR